MYRVKYIINFVVFIVTLKYLFLGLTLYLNLIILKILKIIQVKNNE